MYEKDAGSDSRIFLFSETAFGIPDPAFSARLSLLLLSNLHFGRTIFALRPLFSVFRFRLSVSGQRMMTACTS